MKKIIALILLVLTTSGLTLLFFGGRDAPRRAVVDKTGQSSNRNSQANHNSTVKYDFYDELTRRREKLTTGGAGEPSIAARVPVPATPNATITTVQSNHIQPVNPANIVVRPALAGHPVGIPQTAPTGAQMDNPLTADGAASQGRIALETSDVALIEAPVLEPVEPPLVTQPSTLPIDEATTVVTSNEAPQINVFIDFGQPRVNLDAPQQTTDQWLEHANDVARRTSVTANQRAGTFSQPANRLPPPQPAPQHWPRQQPSAKQTLDEMTRSFEQLGQDFRTNVRFEEANVDNLAEKLNKLANQAGRGARQMEKTSRKLSNVVQQGFNQGYNQGQ